jgi:ribonucleoside-diphosphate reductase alpha chain
MNPEYFHTEISRHIWETKYRFHNGDVSLDQTIEDTWWRIANSLADAENNKRKYWAHKFFDELKGFKFIPGGRIQAGAGTGHQVTLLNCFVMGTIQDSMESIFDSLKEGALTMQQGGGVGYDFSTLRPRGSLAKTTGTIASGPISFMRIWDSMCATLLSTGARRGAMMATLRCDHPDIEEFISAKQDCNELRSFNLSVLVTDELINAIQNDEDWQLVFPISNADDNDQHQTVMRQWSGDATPSPCRVVKTISAKALWENIMHATYEYAEPGVLFIDRINDQNNLWYKEYITATNPCGEIPLPAYGACDLGAINLTQFVQHPFTDDSYIDLDAIKETTIIATRMLDNVIDASEFPLHQQKQQALNCRRIGLGFTGLADALIMLGLDYGKQTARNTAVDIMKTICYTAYYTSINLAEEKSIFPSFKQDEYLAGSFIRTLPKDIKSKIKQHGIRNSHLTTIAPTGTTSILANNISSGIEPVFDYSYSRQVLELDGTYKKYHLKDYAYALWETIDNIDAPLPHQFVTAKRLSPIEHLKMQSALQPYVDNAISKTINVPEDIPYEEFQVLYMMAFKNNLKGCTTYRPNSITGSVLIKD